MAARNYLSRSSELLPEHFIGSGKIDRLSRSQIQRVLLQKAMALDIIHSELGSRSKS
jgi:hypothetical protein